MGRVSEEVVEQNTKNAEFPRKQSAFGKYRIPLPRVPSSGDWLGIRNPVSCSPLTPHFVLKCAVCEKAGPVVRPFVFSAWCSRTSTHLQGVSQGPGSKRRHFVSPLCAMDFTPRLRKSSRRDRINFMEDQVLKLLARRDYVAANVPELLRLLRLARMGCDEIFRGQLQAAGK